MRKLYTCIFLEAFTKEVVLERIWNADKEAPFGSYTRIWKHQHCPKINPYGSHTLMGTTPVRLCPYEVEACGMAFLAAVEDSRQADRSMLGLFSAIAKSRGIERADNKPLARERYDRTYGQRVGSTGLRDGPGAGPSDVVGSPQAPDVARGLPLEGPMGLRRANHRPQSIGALLRGDDPGPRTRPLGWNEREASTDDDGDGGDPVQPPPHGQPVGDEPPAGD